MTSTICDTASSLGDEIVQKRRAMGALEDEVLAALWACDDGATPRDVLDRVGGDLAYTTVMTSLTRLWKKGLVERDRVGRAFVYRPKLTEADLAATRMQAQLQRAADREAALSRFVGTLSRKDERTLRKLLSELGG